MIVVDASVAVKWFLPESGSAEAARLLEPGRQSIVGPDLLGVEVAATLVRGANMVKANRNDAESALAKFKAMAQSGAVQLRRTVSEQIERAARLAITLGHPLKDCVYLVLAMDLACPLITADARFAGRVRATYREVRLLEEQGR